MTRVLLIAHELEAPPGSVGRVLADAGADCDLHVVLADPDAPDTDFPDVARYDAVVALGSHFHVYDERCRSWVDREVALIARLLDSRTPYLGICFGGQLLAQALGGRVERAPAESAEIGMITFDPADSPVPAGPWFTWHVDRVQVPDSAEVIIRNANAIQLFRHGSAVGTQFHPEVDVEIVRRWTEIARGDIPGHTSAHEILGQLAAARDDLEANCERLVLWFLHDVAGIER
jgi:GMP synthase-like glutamine amidotransferase